MFADIWDTILCRCSLSSRDITKKFFNPSLLILKLRKFQSVSNPPCVHVLFEWGNFSAITKYFRCRFCEMTLAEKIFCLAKKKDKFHWRLFLLCILSYFVDSLADVMRCEIFWSGLPFVGFEEAVLQVKIFAILFLHFVMVFDRKYEKGSYILKLVKSRI